MEANGIAPHIPVTIGKNGKSDLRVKAREVVDAQESALKMETMSFRNINTSRASASVNENLPPEGVVVHFGATQHPVVLSVQRT